MARVSNWVWIATGVLAIAGPSACTKQAAPRVKPRDPVILIPPQPSSQKPERPTIDSQCARLEQEQREVFAAALIPKDGLALTESGLSYSIPKQLGRCRRAGLGAWMVRLVDLSASPLGGFVGTVEYAYIGADGAVQRMRDEPLGPRLGGCDRLSFDHLVTFDYNGDKHPELIQCRRAQLHEYRHAGQEPAQWECAECSVLTSQPTIGAYEGNISGLIEEIRDVDADGRPDLLTRGMFESIGMLPDGWCSLHGGCHPDTRGPLLLLHSRADGSFSMDDAVARAEARKVCPEAPKRIFAARPGADEFARGVEALVCALIWQVPWDVIEAELERAERTYCRAKSCSEFRALKSLATAPELSLPKLP